MDAVSSNADRCDVPMFNRPGVQLPRSSIRMWLSRAIDLKFRLVLRIVALAAFCFLATFAYTLIESDRSTRARADWIAQIVAKDLTLQQDQHHWVKFADNGFPDLQTIATPLMTPGVCIAYR